ncbi:hypothetical protein ABB37_04474 [Leptomonas pyrrhocoris]|uniref:Uncharacterized protein n=1 Tax=Leptomonas pyrrhocoris TaxID=157538 RepID=A0A0N0VFG3_LEPPY|nr:hypothetical protein ABB37_04474 [Leptomonas pyrrhocoris]KPA81124.1 hypothetical protein ABB37_04474 [Leptomonas pyrrhocoris]|eukprot:XP_015659563.1 hypothetical protein ABB37_04474 [Leptomonas pyrrhocoris]
MNLTNSIASSDAGAPDSAAAPSMPFPFSFNSFMENLHGWSTDTTAGETSVGFSANNPHAAAGPHEGDKARCASPEEDSGLGFLFHMSDPAAPAAASNTEDALRSFFPPATSEAAANEADNFNFDFASFFLSRGEGSGDDGAKEKRETHTRVFGQDSAQTGPESRLPPSPPQNPTEQVHQVSGFTESDSASRTANTTPDAPRGPRTTSRSNHNATPSTSLCNQTTVNTGPLNFNLPPTAHTVEAAQAESHKGNGQGPNVLPRNSKGPFFSELSLSAALAAASAAPEYAAPHTSTPPQEASKVAEAVTVEVCQANEDGDHNRCNVESRDGVPLAGTNSAGEDNVQGLDENEEDKSEATLQGASAEAIGKDDDEEVGHVSATAAAVAHDAATTTSGIQQPSAPAPMTRKAAVREMETHRAPTENAFPSKTVLPRQSPRGERKMPPTGAAQEGSPSAAASHAVLADLISEAQRVCARAAEVETASRQHLFPSSSAPPRACASHHPRSENTSAPSPSSCSPHESSCEDVAATPVLTAAAGSNAHDAVGASDAVFFAEVAQLQKQSARLSEETAKSAAVFQSQTGDLLRLLGPHTGLAGFLGEAYAATPVVHLAPFLISLLEGLLQDDTDAEDDDEAPENEAELCPSTLNVPDKGVRQM